MPKTVSKPTNVLVAAFDPGSGTRSSLNILRELNYISKAAALGGWISIEYLFEANIEDIRTHLMGRDGNLTRVGNVPLKKEFRIFHFSGHSNEDGIVLLAKNDSSIQPDICALAEFIRVNGRALRLVVLNSCSGLPQAAAIAEFVPYVIAMSAPIFDRTAIEFSRGFYQCYRGTASIPKSFQNSVLQMRLNKLSDANVPRLFRRGEDITKSLLGERANLTESATISEVSDNLVSVLRFIQNLIPNNNKPRDFCISEQIDDLVFRRSSDTTALLEACTGYMTISESRIRYNSIRLVPGPDVHITYHPPRKSRTTNDETVLFFDGDDSSLTARFLGAELLITRPSREQKNEQSN